jgi:hypothetical protein
MPVLEQASDKILEIVSAPLVISETLEASKFPHKRTVVVGRIPYFPTRRVVGLEVPCCIGTSVQGESLSARDRLAGHATRPLRRQGATFGRGLTQAVSRGGPTWARIGHSQPRTTTVRRTQSHSPRRHYGTVPVS